MTVYVDDMKAKFRLMIMCHMAADSDEELLAMADRIDVQRKWHQFPGTWKSHFDIAMTKRAQAVAKGAIEITYRQFGIMCVRRRVEGILGRPEDAKAWAAKHYATDLGIKMMELRAKNNG